MIKKPKNPWGILFFLFLISISIFLTWYCHKKSGYYNWKSEIWADKAGYYIYLPSLFMYHFDASKSPEKIDEKVGYGFVIDRQNNRIITKYTYGVALLVSPFFVLARLLSPVFSLPGEAGFGPMFHIMVNMAAVFYLILGLVFLRKFLLYYFKSGLVFILLFLVYGGTNLLFYAVNDTLMSHVYSFFLFALFLFSMKKFLESTERWLFFIMMSAAFALTVLIRPTNGILILLFFLWDCASRKDIRERIRLFFRADRIILFLAILFVVFLPQMLYWKYSRGSWVSWSYANEGFTNWNRPRILEVWFSTLNGLFLYSPLVLLMVAGMIIMIRGRIRNGWLALTLFLGISYVFGSWYNWYFGCSYGQRSFVEYYAIFAVPLGFSFLEIVKIRNLLVKNLMILLVLAFSYYNVKMILEFDKCFFGSTWDWAQFSRQLDKAHVFITYHKEYAFNNDFENGAISYTNRMADTVSRSGMQSLQILPSREYTPCYSVSIGDLGEKLPENIDAVFWVYNPGNRPVNARFVCSMDLNGANVAWESKTIPQSVTREASWSRVETRFFIPADISRETAVRFYFWNPNKESFFVDDLKIMFK